MMNTQDEIERLKKRIEELENRLKSQLPDNGLIYVGKKNATIDGELRLTAYRVLLRKQGEAPLTLAYASIAQYGSAEKALVAMIAVYEAIIKFTDNI